MHTQILSLSFFLLMSTRTFDFFLPTLQKLLPNVNVYSIVSNFGINEKCIKVIKFAMNLINIHRVMNIYMHKINFYLGYKAKQAWN